jgi:hypothetical protein
VRTTAPARRTAAKAAPPAAKRAQKRR